jgi:hypothetical protein
MAKRTPATPVRRSDVSMVACWNDGSAARRYSFSTTHRVTAAVASAHFVPRASLKALY